MGILSTLLLVVFVITALFLILIVMIQDDQGDGIGGIFGGGSTTPFGTNSGNVLTRLTSILGAVFLIVSFGLAWINRTTDVGDVAGAARKEATAQASEWWNTQDSSDDTSVTE
ncbi:preprotein translocase subunit SecG [Spirochaeta cellobiosiphila]|uniref:preprotein translocase subunit SecG n=1 Tax=Spirochaeta cellobiosiphila TaxID=504483 RepID=UPI000423EEDE|nr:preprotein translocase subunit SecG [Spirochaeta cellobiosiphila]